MPEQYYPVLLAMGVAIVLGVVMLSLSHLLSSLMGNQTGGRVKGTAIESGSPLLDASQKRISIAFFLVAIDFIVFDLEAAFAGSGYRLHQCDTRSSSCQEPWRTFAA